MRGRLVAGFALLASAVWLSACMTERATSPIRSATEQLLISTAADRAAEKLAEQIMPNIKAFLETDLIGVPDASYAALAIRDRFLRRGVQLVDDKSMADAVIEVRIAALSTDESSIFIGTPSLPLPTLPGYTATGVLLPALNLFKRATTQATAKFAATGYDSKTGKLVVATDPQYGFSHKVDWAVLFLFSWTNQDFIEPATTKAD
jgi:hypothetical protein